MRDNKRPKRDFGRNFNPGNGPKKEMHKATCAKCQKDCEVPFRPREGRPVLCRDCFSKEKGF